VTYRVKEGALDHLTIGEVAKAAGVHKETIRYYQTLGLVGQPERPAGSVRRYGADAIARLRFIKRAQELGFTLEEVKRLLLLEDGQNCAATRRVAEQKLALVRKRIADLSRMRRMLENLVEECEQGGRPRSCPIIATLSSGTTPAPRKR
jgi:MerR family mercuric resistance operon transcriptional regulator